MRHRTGHRSGFGQITFGNPTEEVLRDPSDPSRTLKAIRTTYIWRPAKKIARHLPQDFQIELQMLQSTDAERPRRFAPPNLAAFILQASLAGHAILLSTGKVSRARSWKLHAARLVYQLGPRLREHFSRSLKRCTDLMRAGVRRVTRNEHGVLPEVIGHGPDYPEGWTIRQLLREGHEAARASQHTGRISEATRIRFGLWRAAALSPILLSDTTLAERRYIVRAALFGDSPCEVPPAKIRTRIRKRFLDALRRHLDDDTTMFNHWFFENMNDIAHQVGKRKGDGGVIGRDQVRTEILEFVIESYWSVAKFVDTFTRSFAAALPFSLSAADTAVFRAIYYARPELGGMPVVLLQDRFPVVREAILDIMDQPSELRNWGVLLRLLNYYGDLVRNKRASDAEYKRRGQHRNTTGRGAVVHTLNIGRDQSCSLHLDAARLPEVFSILAERQNRRCKCGSTSWHGTLAEGGLTADRVTYDEGCTSCDAPPQRRTVDRGDFDAILRSISADEKS